MDERKAKFVDAYVAGSTFEEAAEEVGGDEHEVSGWLVDDPEFAEIFERAMAAKAMRVRQKAIDAMRQVAEKMIELASSGKAASVSAARFVQELSKGERASKRSDDDGEEWGSAAGSDPEDYAGEMEEIARGIRKK